MKKLIVLCLLAALLTGYKAQETFETVEDLPVVETTAVAKQFFVALPEDAATPTLRESETPLMGIFIMFSFPSYQSLEIP